MVTCVQGPGQLVVLAPSSATRFAKFHFGEETVVTGVLITTHLDHTLRSFRVFANTRTSDPYDYTTEPQLMSLEFNVSYLSSTSLPVNFLPSQQFYDICRRSVYMKVWSI